MPEFDCHLIVHNARAYQMRQAVAGFIELRHQGVVALTWDVRDDSDYAYLEVVVNGRQRLLYDMQDSGRQVAPDLNWKRVDRYFKRSFDPGIAAAVSDRIRPLGLNYVVNSRHGLIQGPVRGRSVAMLVRRLRDACLGPGFVLEDFERPARRVREQVCFMTRLWDPADAEVEDADVQQEREALNAFRIACIRRCKAAFKDRFVGGVVDSAHARRCCPDCIVADPRQTRRRQYLDTVKTSAVCVTTTGLHGSTSWKFGEYVAMGKAIVAEPLRYVVPGELAADSHYLAFDDVDRLQAGIERLLGDVGCRREMEAANRRYYQDWLRADRMIWHTLVECGEREIRGAL